MVWEMLHVFWAQINNFYPRRGIKKKRRGGGVLSSKKDKNLELVCCLEYNLFV